MSRPFRPTWLLFLWIGCSPAEGPAKEGAPERPPTVAAAPVPASEDEAPEEPPGEPKRLFAKRFVAKVRSAPRAEAPRIGYLRGGAVIQGKTDRPVGFEGCPGGWYELETGGFACARRDVTPFLGDRLPEVRARQPDRKAKLPYDYAFIRRNKTPMYTHLPSDEEASVYEGYRIPGKESGESESAGESQSVDTPDKSASAGENESESQSESAGAIVEKSADKSADADPEKKNQAANDENENENAAEAEEITADAGPPTLERLMADEEDGDVFLRWLMRGFYVSLDREFTAGSRRYFRTQDNGFVPVRSIMPVSGSDFQGRVLDGETWALPMGAVISKRRARWYTRRDDGRLVPERKPPEYHHMFRMLGKEEVRGKTYLVGGDEHLYSDRSIRILEAAPRPEGVLPDEKWIDVNLTSQTLVAYEGDSPVFATLISSGRIKNENHPDMNHATPTGLFRISAKHLTHKMDGDNAIDGPYSIDDVPYVMYFELAYAIHSAFWHHLFGRPKSHGCVNMSPLDARFLFDWSEPKLPPGWHGVYPTEEHPGTAIHIHGETPKG